MIENGPGDRFTGVAGDGHRWSRDVRDESRTGGPPRSDCIRLNLPLKTTKLYDRTADTVTVDEIESAS